MKTLIKMGHELVSATFLLSTTAEAAGKSWDGTLPTGARNFDNRPGQVARFSIYLRQRFALTPGVEVELLSSVDFGSDGTDPRADLEDALRVRVHIAPNTPAFTDVPLQIIGYAEWTDTPDAWQPSAVSSTPGAFLSVKDEQGGGLDSSWAAATLQSGGGGAAPYILIREIKSTGESVGIGLYWAPRELNTKVIDTDNLATMLGYDVKLAAGTYRVRASVPALACGAFTGQLVDISSPYPPVATGTTEYSPDSGVGSTPVSRSFVTGRFTTDGTKTFELQAQSQTNNGTGGGVTISFQNVLSEIEFWKE